MYIVNVLAKTTFSLSTSITMSPDPMDYLALLQLATYQEGKTHHVALSYSP